MGGFWFLVILPASILISTATVGQPAPILELAPQGKLRVGMLGYNPHG
jgi:hypothetical protein